MYCDYFNDKVVTFISYGGILMDLKIMTFNVLNGWSTSNIGKRDDLAASAILEHEPDIIGFQELDGNYRLAEDPLPKLISPKYSEAGAEHTSWNPIFYNTERLRVVACGEQAFEKGTVYDYPLGGISGFRTISYALLEDMSAMKKVLVFNLHYDMNKDWQTCLDNQAAESRQVLSLAKELLQKYEADALFVTGDYNSKISGVPCVSMLENGFVDTHALAEENDDMGSCARLGEALWGDYNSAAIDHVFYMGRAMLRVKKYETVDNIREASDHSPVCVTVEIN